MRDQLWFSSFVFSHSFPVTGCVGSMCRPAWLTCSRVPICSQSSCSFGCYFCFLAFTPWLELLPSVFRLQMPSPCPPWLDEHACLFQRRPPGIPCPFLPSCFSTMPVASSVFCRQGRGRRLSLGWTLLPDSCSRAPPGLSARPPLLSLLSVWWAGGRAGSP